MNRWLISAALVLALLLSACAGTQRAAERNQAEYAAWCDKQETPKVELSLPAVASNVMPLTAAWPVSSTGALRYGPVGSEPQKMLSNEPVSRTDFPIDLVPEGKYTVALTATYTFAPPRNLEIQEPCVHAAGTLATLVIDRTPPAIEVAASMAESNYPSAGFRLVITVSDKLSGPQAVKVEGLVQTKVISAPIAGSFDLPYEILRREHLTVIAVDGAGMEATQDVSIPLPPSRWQSMQADGLHIRTNQTPPEWDPIFGYGWGVTWQKYEGGNPSGEPLTTPLWWYLLVFVGPIVLVLVVALTFIIGTRRRRDAALRARLQRVDQDFAIAWNAYLDAEWAVVETYLLRLSKEDRALINPEDASHMQEMENGYRAGIANDVRLGVPATLAIQQQEWETALSYIRQMDAGWEGRYSREALLAEVLVGAAEGNQLAIALQALRLLPTGSSKVQSAIALVKMGVQLGNWTLAMDAADVIPVGNNWRESLLHDIARGAIAAKQSEVALRALNQETPSNARAELAHELAMQEIAAQNWDAAYATLALIPAEDGLGAQGIYEIARKAIQTGANEVALHALQQSPPRGVQLERGGLLLTLVSRFGQAQQWDLAYAAVMLLPPEWANERMNREQLRVLMATNWGKALAEEWQREHPLAVQNGATADYYAVLGLSGTPPSEVTEEMIQTQLELLRNALDPTIGLSMLFFARTYLGIAPNVPDEAVAMIVRTGAPHALLAEAAMVLGNPATRNLYDTEHVEEHFEEVAVVAAAPSILASDERVPEEGSAIQSAHISLEERLALAATPGASSDSTEDETGAGLLQL